MKSLKLGLIGLGSMGSEMATKFLTAGYRLTVYDIDANQLQGSFASGAKIAESSTHLTQTVDVVMTSLRSSAVWGAPTEGTWNQTRGRTLVRCHFPVRLIMSAC